MINKQILIGNVGGDPDVRQVSNTTCCRVSVATTHGVKKGEGWENKTTWHKVVVWGKEADYAAKAKKGQRVYIEGRTEHREYEDKEGIKRVAVEVIASSFKILEKIERQEATEASREAEIFPASDDGTMPF